MSTIRVNSIQHTTANSGNMILHANGNVSMLTANSTLFIGNTSISNAGISVSGSAISAASGMINRVINGDMRIDQRNSGSSTTPSATTYCLDRWRLIMSVASKVTVQQQSIVSPQSCDGQRYTASLSTASVYSCGSGDYFGLNQFIEGYNCADLAWGTSAAKTVTLSFWVYCGLTGSFGGAIRTGDGSNYSYPFQYTINNANTWEKKTITIPGPTSGTWGTGTSTGIDVWFSFATGSTYTGPANAWAAANYVNSTGSTNIVATSSASGGNWYITGVQFEIGSVATPFEYRNYTTELQLCQRYYYGWSFNSNQGPGAQWMNGTGGGSGAINVWLPVNMRATPTITSYFNSYNGGSTSGVATSVWNNNKMVRMETATVYGSTLDTFTASAEL